MQKFLSIVKIAGYYAVNCVCWAAEVGGCLLLGMMLGMWLSYYFGRRLGPGGNWNDHRRLMELSILIAVVLLGEALREFAPINGISSFCVAAFWVGSCCGFKVESSKLYELMKDPKYRNSPDDL